MIRKLKIESEKEYNKLLRELEQDKKSLETLSRKKIQVKKSKLLDVEQITIQLGLIENSENNLNKRIIESEHRLNELKILLKKL